MNQKQLQTYVQSDHITWNRLQSPWAKKKNHSQISNYLFPNETLEIYTELLECMTHKNYVSFHPTPFET